MNKKKYSGKQRKFSVNKLEELDGWRGKIVHREILPPISGGSPYIVKSLADLNRSPRYPKNYYSKSYVYSNSNKQELIFKNPLANNNQEASKKAPENRIEIGYSISLNYLPSNNPAKNEDFHKEFREKIDIEESTVCEKEITELKVTADETENNPLSDSQFSENFEVFSPKEKAAKNKNKIFKHRNSLPKDLEDNEISDSSKKKIFVFPCAVNQNKPSKINENSFESSKKKEKINTVKTISLLDHDFGYENKTEALQKTKINFSKDTDLARTSQSKFKISQNPPKKAQKNHPASNKKKPKYLSPPNPRNPKKEIKLSKSKVPESRTKTRSKAVVELFTEPNDNTDSPGSSNRETNLAYSPGKDSLLDESSLKTFERPFLVNYSNSAERFSAVSPRSDKETTENEQFLKETKIFPRTKQQNKSVIPSSYSRPNLRLVKSPEGVSRLEPVDWNAKNKTQANSARNTSFPVKTLIKNNPGQLGAYKIVENSQEKSSSLIENKNNVEEYTEEDVKIELENLKKIIMYKDTTSPDNILDEDAESPFEGLSNTPVNKFINNFSCSLIGSLHVMLCSFMDSFSESIVDQEEPDENKIFNFFPDMKSAVRKERINKRMTIELNVIIKSSRLKYQKIDMKGLEVLKRRVTSSNISHGIKKEMLNYLNDIYDKIEKKTVVKQLKNILRTKLNIQTEEEMNEYESNEHLSLNRKLSLLEKQINKDSEEVSSISYETEDINKALNKFPLGRSTTLSIFSAKIDHSIIPQKVSDFLVDRNIPLKVVDSLDIQNLASYLEKVHFFKLKEKELAYFESNINLIIQDPKELDLRQINELELKRIKKYIKAKKNPSINNIIK